MNSVIKSITSLILVSVFILHIFGKTIIYADYVVHKEYITKFLCINKDKPQMHCNGQCHLKKELSKQENKEDSPVSLIKQIKEIQFITESHFELTLLATSVTDELNTHYIFSRSEKYLHSLFHPPKV